MPEMRPPSDLFGVPLVLRRQDARQLLHALAGLWIAQTGQPMRTTREDLEYLFGKLFNPRTSGARLRDILDALPDAPAVRSRLLKAPLVIPAGPSLIVTPEGRAVYSVLSEILEASDDDPIAIDPTDSLVLVSLAYEGYRRVGVRRLRDAIRLLSGEAEALRLPSIGLVLLVLINGSVSAESAIRRPRDPEELRRLDASVAKAVAAFADSVSSGSRDPSHYSLYSGYAVTEARRRLGNALGPSPDEIYIDSEERAAVVMRVAREIRRNRRAPKSARIMIAFDNLVTAYRGERPTLASLGVTHESRAETARLRTQLENALGDP